tara:strand:+ start:975 stop:2081 length:1107 start_codon:yes stop_codon:yes gene_type:complete
MALPVAGGNPPSNPIKYSQIIAEFGTPTNTNAGLGDFRVSENIGSLSGLPLDADTCGINANADIPQSGEIKFSDFYNSRLNQVVDLHSIGDNTSRQNAKDRWNNGNVYIVGSPKTGKTQPPDTVDDKIIINVDAKISSSKGTQTHCALRTGSWDSNTTLSIEIGTSGKLYGAGGDGGDGGSSNETAGTDGGDGTSALGIDYPCTINNLGVIQGGYGGGGGGGGNTKTTGGGKKSGAATHGSSGGGGGGGAGLPAGNAGGVQEPTDEGDGTAGSAGEAGKLSDVAIGGDGGDEAGEGGNSGGINQSGGATFHQASDGVKPEGAAYNNNTGANGGLGGKNGFALITNQSSLPSLTGNPVTGITTTSLNPT